MKKLTLAMVIITLLFALVVTVFAKPGPSRDFWNWKCYDSYVDSMRCSEGLCSSPQAGDDCTAYCNGSLQVVECQYGCQYSFCDDEGW